MELNIFGVRKLGARTWRTESGHTYLEVTLIDFIGNCSTINLVTDRSWKEFGLAAKGINEAFL